MKKSFLFSVLVMLFVSFSFSEANAVNCPNPSSSSISKTQRRSTNQVKAPNSEEVDAFLNEYERLTNNFIACLDALEQGDLTALVTLQTTAEEVDEFGKELKKYDANKFSKAQQERFVLITANMYNAYKRLEVIKNQF